MAKIAAGLVGLGLICMVTASAIAQNPSRGEGAARSSYARPHAIPFPADNPYSSAKAGLGEKLFFDTILSRSRTNACSTCHQPKLAWADGLPVAVGDNHQRMNRRSPTLLNLAWLARLGWDGSFRDIESVGFTAITGPANMGLPESMAIDRLEGDPDYKREFERIFGKDGITRSTVEAALATYERTIVSGIAPFDRWVNGDEHAIDEAAKRGFALFNGRANCSGCHSSWTFTDGSYHDIGTAGGTDIGRARFFPSSVKLRYAFKTPGLRDISLRAPYMHDGSIKTLADVVDHYDRGGIDRPSRAELIKPLELTVQEKADLLAFMRTLSTDTPSTMPPETKAED